MRWMALYFVFFMPALAAAQDVNVDMAQSRVEITTGFTGSHVTLYGVRKRAGELAVIIQGPQRKMSVRRKDSVMGAWFNLETYRFNDVPIFYDYALTAAFPQKLARENNIGVWPERFPAKGHEEDEELLSFQQALIRNKRAQGLYPEEPKAIEFMDDQFFKVSFDLPANVPVGEYVIDTYYARGGRILARESRAISVEQVGASANLKAFSRQNGFVYGLVCVFMAVFAGWISHRIRGRA